MAHKFNIGQIVELEPRRFHLKRQARNYSTSTSPAIVSGEPSAMRRKRVSSRWRLDPLWTKNLWKPTAAAERAITCWH
jgi:hypothetical protein